MGPLGRLRRLRRHLTSKFQFDWFRLNCLLLLPLIIIFAVCLSWPPDPPSPSKPVYFVSLGDHGTGSVEQIAVAHQMAEVARLYDARFVLTLGDNFYPRGISGLEDPTIKNYFEAIYEDNSLQVPWYKIWNISNFLQTRGPPMFSISPLVTMIIGAVLLLRLHTPIIPRWQMPSPYYVKHIPLGKTSCLDLIITDSIGLEGVIAHQNETRRFSEDYSEEYAGAEAGQKQLEWLTNVLRNSKAIWRIVVGHRPLQSCATRSRLPIEERLRDLLHPLFIKYGVHVYMHGHDHIGQHSVDDGVLYVGNGVGGFGNHKAIPNNSTVWFGASYMGFILHKATRHQLDFKFKDCKGKTLHKIKLRHNYDSDARG